jgi:hypothetical protein
MRARARVTPIINGARVIIQILVRIPEIRNKPMSQGIIR